MGADDAGGDGWPRSSAELLAVSRDEAWLAGSDAILRAGSSGVATLAPLLGSPSPTSFTRDLARTSDGSVWAASDSGAFRFDGTASGAMDTRPASAIAVGPDGVVWIAGQSRSDTFGEVVVRSYRLIGGSWRAGPVETTDLVSGRAALAVGQDGTLWLGSVGS